MSARQQILDLHQQAIQAHLDGDVSFFTQDIAPDYFNAGKGGITYPEKAEITAMFSGYLGSTTFSHYEDVEEPIIHISDDESLATCLVRVRVAGTRQMEEGPVEFDSLWTWITLFRKIEGTWIRMGVLSA
ncbi:MAG: nuclear transport factor 2 family protein [Candidatus Kariarchaeaceae archaeon]|jgi:hypothetical protein